MEQQYDTVATGGTFDIIHIGHQKLLEKSFSVSKHVIIGLSSDEFAKRKGKELINPYQTRKANLEKFINKNYPKKSYTISRLDDDFGPAALEKRVEALVVSKEKSHQGDTLNKMRREKGNPPADTLVVPMVLAKDGARISTTRIRNKEIDESGNLL